MDSPHYVVVYYVVCGIGAMICLKAKRVVHFLLCLMSRYFSSRKTSIRCGRICLGIMEKLICADSPFVVATMMQVIALRVLCKLDSIAPHTYSLGVHSVYKAK